MQQGHSTAKERRDLLTNQRETLIKRREDIDKTIDRLNYKIEIYNEIVKGKRKDFMEEP